MTPVQVMGGPAAWIGTAMQGSGEWRVDLTNAHRQELLAALAQVDRPGKVVSDIGIREYQLPSLAPVLAGVRREVVGGRGFVLLRGVPVEGCSERETELLTWLLGLHVGIPIPQERGMAVLHVRDEGVDRSHRWARAYQHAGRLGYHTDSSDVVALLCVRPAKSGGVSTIVSSVAIHDELVRRRPDLAALLYGRWWHDRRSGDGPDSFFQCPIYAVNQRGQLFTYYGPSYVRSAPRGEGVPELTEQQLEALDVLDALSNEPQFVLNMAFRAGDLQFLNNYRVMHARTEFEDHEEPERKRDLVRLWLTVDDDLGLPGSMNERGLTLRTAAFKR